MRVPPNGVRFELFWPHVGTGVNVSTITYMGKFISPPSNEIGDILKLNIRRNKAWIATLDMQTIPPVLKKNMDLRILVWKQVWI